MPSLFKFVLFSCRANVIITMAFCGILAVSIIIANLTIIIVILRNPRFPTSQLIYKLSLAFADILVGIFVVPSFIITLYAFHIAPYQKKIEIEYYENKSRNLINSVYMFNQNANIYYRPELSSSYRNFFGFMTTFSLFNSIFTLMFASIDRYNSLSKALRYKKCKAILNAKRFTIGIYFVSFVFALLPIVAPKLGKYRIVAGGVLISVIGETTLYMIAPALLIPFIIMWIFTIGVIINLTKQKKLRKKLTPNNQKYDFTTENQLSKTLSIMVGVFTMCILPSFVFVVVPPFFPSLLPQNTQQFSLRSAAAIQSIELAITIVFASNSLWNAFIYTFRNKQFRKDATVFYNTVASVLGLQKIKKYILESQLMQRLRCLFVRPVREKRFPTIVAITTFQNSTCICTNSSFDHFEYFFQNTRL